MLTQCTLLKQIFLPVFGGVAVMLRAVQKVIQRHYFFFLESSKSEGAVYLSSTSIFHKPFNLKIKILGRHSL